jgi:hypothetical protein
MIEAYPLCWPNNKPRTPKQARTRAKFSKKEKSYSTDYVYSHSSSKALTVAQALSRVTRELESFTRTGRNYRIPPDTIVISTNIKVNRNGLPYSETKQPDDVGVAVYFQLDGKNYCLPCDKWDRVADNLAAIASHLGALRGIERWGVGETHDVFTGFRALPSTEPAKREWHDILGVRWNASYQEAEAAYKKKVVQCHPDKPGGSHEAFIELQEAWAVVEKHLKP